MRDVLILQRVSSPIRYLSIYLGPEQPSVRVWHRMAGVGSARPPASEAASRSSIWQPELARTDPRPISSAATPQAVRVT